MVMTQQEPSGLAYKDESSEEDGRLLRLDGCSGMSEL